MKFRFIFILAMVVAVNALVRSSVMAQTLTIDDFDHSGYTSGQEIATGAASTPWLRSGSVEDGLYVKTAASQDPAGTYGAQIPVDPTPGTGSTSVAIAARNYGTATNFSTYNQATVLSKSEATTTADSLQLYLSDGTTVYVSTVAQPEGIASKMFTFPMTSSFFMRTQGSDLFSTVLSTATAIGFQMTSSTGAGETIAFDDFAVESTPEPSSAALVFVALGAVALRRRRAPAA